MARLKKMFLILTILIISLIAGIFMIDFWVQFRGEEQLFEDTANIPENKAGLLLGTSKYLRNGNINLFYKYRIDAAIKLYKAGKISYIIASGDNGTKSYDEPTQMKKDLIKNGIPENRIYCDYAGFRTLDSVIRCKEIFGQQKITIISQKFHNERAVFIAKSKGIDAVGFAAKEIKGRYGLKVRIREKFARVKLILDLVFGVGPKFLGKKIDIG
jgi:SanA protein